MRQGYNGFCRLDLRLYASRRLAKALDREASQFICICREIAASMAKRIKSGIKRVEIAERNRIRNVAVKSEVKTRIKQAVTALGSADAEGTATVTAISAIDRAARKGVIHPNKAARLKSRLMKRVNAAVAH